MAGLVPLATRNVINPTHGRVLTFLVPRVGLEPTLLTEFDLKSNAATITPPGRVRSAASACTHGVRTMPGKGFLTRACAVRPLFLPRCVGCRLWQLGQRIRRLLSLLSVRSPFMWSNSIGIRPSSERSAHLHSSHRADLNPSAINRFLSLWLWYTLFLISISESRCAGTVGLWLFSFHPLPVKCFVLSFNCLIRVFI